ncbi:MAG: polysaccharide deacetylase family protein [Ruminococcus sp.]|nr:polysaccharide deacetylase family protein [Ruminococcus sp.]
MNRYLKLAILGAAVAGIVAAVGCAKTSQEDSTGSVSKQENSESTEPTVTKRQYKNPEEYGKVIALTFDDGPSSATPLVLDKLEEYGAVGTFFLIGDNITDDKTDIVKRAYEMGCEIANHSKTHSYMSKMTEDEMKQEIDYTTDKIVEIIGEEPKFFRPPYIDVNQQMYDTIDLTFICGYGCNDYDAKVEIEERVEKTLAQAKDGAIILLHDAEGNIKTVAALDKIIPELQSQGYELVTVDELFHTKGITPDGNSMYSEVG